MKIKSSYDKIWVNFHEQNEAKFLEIDPTYFEKPFEHLPQHMMLDQEEKKLLAFLEDKKGWNSQEFLTLTKLKEKRRESDEDFDFIQASLAKLVEACHNHGIHLPSQFLAFFQSQDYISRFRTSDLKFIAYHSPIPFPEDQTYFIIPFFGDSQGFGWWYLLLNRQSEHCVLYNAYYWNEIPESLRPNEPPPKYLICADSFSEFIVRLSFDVRIIEGDHLDFQ